MRKRRFFQKLKLKKKLSPLKLKKIVSKIKGYVTFKDAAGWHAIIKDYLTPTGRRLLFKKFGPKAFLLPEELKYPVVDPKTGKLHPKGLIAAAFYGYLYGVLGRMKNHLKAFKKALNLLRKKFHVALKIRGVYWTAVGNKIITFFKKRLKHLKL